MKCFKEISACCFYFTIFFVFFSFFFLLHLLHFVVVFLFSLTRHFQVEERKSTYILMKLLQMIFVSSYFFFFVFSVQMNCGREKRCKSKIKLFIFEGWWKKKSIFILLFHRNYWDFTALNKLLKIFFLYLNYRWKISCFSVWFCFSLFFFIWSTRYLTYFCFWWTELDVET